MSGRVDHIGAAFTGIDRMHRARPREGGCMSTTDLIDPALWRGLADALERRDFEEAHRLVGLEGVPGDVVYHLQEDLWHGGYDPDGEGGLDWLLEAAVWRLRAEALCAQAAREHWPNDTYDIACAQLVGQAGKGGGA